MDFFPGFAWPLPMAFAGALQSCRFEQGDVLYSEAAAYDPWPAGRKGLRHAIQVLDPPRSARAIAGDGEGKRFHASWESAVSFDLVDPASGASEERASTQGRLFSCLWKGELRFLDTAESDDPEPPLLLRDLQQRLDEAVPALARGFRKEKGKGLLFAQAIDLASDSSRSKAESILTALASHFDGRARDLSPAEARLPDADRFHPSLLLRGIAVTTRDEAAVQDTLKPLLYSGRGGGGSGDRFQLSRHGALTPL